MQNYSDIPASTILTPNISGQVVDTEGKKVPKNSRALRLGKLSPVKQIRVLPQITAGYGKEQLIGKDAHLAARTPEDAEKHWARLSTVPPRRGASHPRTKLVDGQVRAIRALRVNRVPFNTIASEFGMTVKGVEKIIYGEWWCHILPR